MTRAERTEADLAATLALLMKPHSAEQLAKALGITEQSAHNRMKALRARGVKFRERREKMSIAGPKTVFYSVIPPTHAVEEE